MRCAAVPGVVLVAVMCLVSGRGVAAQDATPPTLPAEVDPALCTVEPRPLEFYRQFLTPVVATPLPEASPTPAGEPADAATTAAVTATWLEVLACRNAGAQRRVDALYTDRGFYEATVRPYAEAGGYVLFEEDLTFLATPQPPLAEPDRVVLVAVGEVRALPDGRVTARFEVRDPLLAPPGGDATGTFQVVFARVGERWLVDGQEVLAIAGTPTP